MTTHVENDIRQRARNIGYIKKVIYREDSEDRQLILRFTDKLNNTLNLIDTEIVKSFEAVDVGSISISIEEMSEPAEGINILRAELQEDYILAVDQTVNGFAVYKTNARFDSESRVEIRLIHNKDARTDKYI